MNLESGIFTATRTGTYFFSLAGTVKFTAESSSLQYLELSLYKNDDQQIDYDSVELMIVNNDSEDLPLNIQAMLELKPDDQICLKISSKSQESYLLYVPYFSGWMLEEKLSMS